MHAPLAQVVLSDRNWMCVVLVILRGSFVTGGATRRVEEQLQILLLQLIALFFTELEAALPEQLQTLWRDVGLPNWC